MISLAHLTVLDADPLTLIDSAAAGRFDAVGLRIVPPMPTDRIVPVIGNARLIGEIERRLDSTGVRILDIEAVWLMPHTDVTALKPALELGARLGAKYLLVVGNDPDWARQRDNFALLCDLAQGCGSRHCPRTHVLRRTEDARPGATTARPGPPAECGPADRCPAFLSFGRTSARSCRDRSESLSLHPSLRCLCRGA